jgi:hypothetical protein
MAGGAHDSPSEARYRKPSRISLASRAACCEGVARYALDPANAERLWERSLELIAGADA